MQCRCMSHVISVSRITNLQPHGVSLEDHVELNQGERNQEELQGIAIAEEVSIDNFALIVI